MKLLRKMGITVAITSILFFGTTLTTSAADTESGANAPSDRETGTVK